MKTEKLQQRAETGRQSTEMFHQGMYSNLLKRALILKASVKALKSFTFDSNNYQSTPKSSLSPTRYKWVSV